MASVCFVVRNAFQAQHVAALAQSLGATLVAAPKLAATLDYENVRAWRKAWWKLDGVYDVIVAQGAFQGAGFVKTSKIAFIQYGYAKEPYNFDAWRGLCDLNLAYGPYAASKMAHFAPSRAVGHPRQAEVTSDRFHQTAKAKYPAANPNLPTLLYAPTWGELSSFDLFSDAILALGDRYNLLLKLHHNTASREAARVDALGAKGAQFFGAGDDLFALAAASDVVISDYSGAIFDALLLEKPVVLLDVAHATDALKMDGNSLEIAQRDALGHRVTDASALEGAIKASLATPLDTTALMHTLYADVANPHAAIGQALVELASDQIEPTQMQGYAMRYLRKQDRQMEKIKRIGLIAIVAALVLGLWLLVQALF